MIRPLCGLVALLLLVDLIPASPACGRPDNNHQPVIGVLAELNDAPVVGPAVPYIAASYVKFVEMGGARVVPVFDRQNDDYYDYLFSRLNGFLIPGNRKNKNKPNQYKWDKMAIG